jgi:hypothetical protein
MRASAHSPHVARAATVAQQIDVQLELLTAGSQREHPVVQLLEGSAGPQQP